MRQPTPRRTPDPAPVVCPAAAFLSVPLCGPDVPARIDLSVPRTEGEQLQARAEIARRLLGMGVLRETDWTGEIASSLDYGLLRWACEELGASKLQIADFDLIYTDNIEVFGFETNVGDGHYDSGYYRKKIRPGVSIGGFALEANGWQQAFVERAVRAWEEVVPGLGFGLVDLLEHAFWKTTGCAGPDWVCTELEQSDWDEEEAEESGYLTLERFQKGLPAKLFTARWNPTLAEKALRKRKPPLTPEQRQVMEEALELSERTTAARSAPRYHSGLRDIYNVQQVVPFGVRWNDEDDMDRVIDDYHNMLCQVDEQTEICFLQTFDLNAPAWEETSLELAVKNMGTTIDLLARADRLLVALNGDSKPLGKRPRRRKVTPLVEVFAQERAAQEVAVAVNATQERMRLRV